MNKYMSKALRVSYRAFKEVGHSLVPPDVPRTTVFVQGCNRSGTSMVTQVFDQDWRSRVFYEFTPFTRDQPLKLHYPSLDVVENHFYRRNGQFVVAKPLVESGRLPELLDYFNGYAVWMYRDFRDVIASNLARWGIENQYSNMYPIVYGLESNWRAAGLSQETRERVKYYHYDGITPEDAGALYWYARNRLFFDLGLHHDLRVRLCNYEEFVQLPDDAIHSIYRFIGVPRPPACLSKGVSSSSVGKGCCIQLTEEIDMLCTALSKRMVTLELKQLGKENGG